MRLEMGRYVLAEDYVRAMQAARSAQAATWIARSSGCDALLLPTLPIGAPPLGATTVEFGDRDEPVRAVMLRLTQLFNVTGPPGDRDAGRGRGSDGLPTEHPAGRRDGTSRRPARLPATVERYICGGAGSVGGGTG